MILISKTFQKIIRLIVICCLLLPVISNAQESLTLSVSPTLFEMTANPAQNWTSSVRIINGNPYDIAVYVDVLNFAPQGESGQVKFLPLLVTESEGETLAEWIKPDFKEVTVPAEQVLEIPFVISVPDDAPPGGHFAAILVGTKSLNSGGRKSQVQTAQVVTSLVFLRVTGDVIEDGFVREFRSAKFIVEKPEMDFELRFENKGNVQILPQGDIRIFNMWGQERGIIPINKQTMFGNVLPDQIRKYTFKWEGDWSLSDTGRYSAIVTLAYGEEDRQFASSKTSFWVIPWKILLIILTILFLIITLVTWAIKIYIKKMLSMAGVSSNPQVTKGYSVQKINRKVSIVAPIEEGILDLRNSFRASDTWSQKFLSITTFMSRYRLFFLVSIVVVGVLVMIALYVRSASVSERPYQVVIDGVNDGSVISSEQMEYEALKKDSLGYSEVIKESFPAIMIVNQSGVNGLAAKLRLKLEHSGYPITQLESDLDNHEEKSAIVYAPEYAKEALELSESVGGVPVSAYEKASGSETPIIIYLGKDFINEL